MKWGTGKLHSWGLSPDTNALCCWQQSKQLTFDCSKTHKRSHRHVHYKTGKRRTLRSFFVPTRNSWTAVGSFSFRASSSHCLYTEQDKLETKSCTSPNNLCIMKELTSHGPERRRHLHQTQWSQLEEEKALHQFTASFSPLISERGSLVHKSLTLSSSVVRRSNALEPLLACGVPAVTERETGEKYNIRRTLFTLIYG